MAGVNQERIRLFGPPPDNVFYASAAAAAFIIPLAWTTAVNDGGIYSLQLANAGSAQTATLSDVAGTRWIVNLPAGDTVTLKFSPPLPWKGALSVTPSGVGPFYCVARVLKFR